mmetsp:Transcript_7900/g.14887  ORF Transcript_7900/g.14887 Transcript_7900/m.14887 type:complete len:162 (+) Transcript_7900:2105-2590(+)
MYEDSIYFGMEGLTDVSRSYPGAHKYVALSMRERGNLDSAIDLMNCAVLYEAPWDDRNRLEAINLYKELCAFKADGLQSEKYMKSEKRMESETSAKSKKSRDDTDSITDKLFKQAMLIEAYESGKLYEDHHNYYDECNEDYDDNDGCDPYYFHYNNEDMWS